MARVRRHKILKIAVERHLSLVARGTPTVLAGELGVSRVTVWRDIRTILGQLNEGWPCPVCGTEGDWVPVGNDVVDDLSETHTLKE